MMKLRMFCPKGIVEELREPFHEKNFRQRAETCCRSF